VLAITPPSIMGAAFFSCAVMLARLKPAQFGASTGIKYKEKAGHRFARE
jgi:hypothetical protein